MDYTDDFNRADENPLSGGGNWSGSSGNDLQIVSNIVVPVTASTASSMYYTAGTFSNDQYSQAVWAGGVAMVGVTVRSTATTWYCFRILSTIAAEIYKRNPSQWAITNSFAVSIADGDTIKLTAVGTTLCAYINDVLVKTCTDSDLDSGNAGIYLECSAGNGLDSWAGGDMPPANLSISVADCSTSYCAIGP